MKGLHYYHIKIFKDSFCHARIFSILPCCISGGLDSKSGLCVIKKQRNTNRNKHSPEILTPVFCVAVGSRNH